MLEHRNRRVKAGGWAEIILVEPDVVSTIEGNVIMRKHALRRRIAAVAAAWASTLLLLLWWYFATLSPADTRPLPSPAEVVGAWNDLDAEGLLWPSIGISLLRVASGLALGIILAVPAGLVAGASRVGLAIIDKPIHMLRAVPFPALAPLFIVVFGIGETMKIGLITVGVFGLVYVNLRDGVRNLDPRLFELAKVYHFSRATLFLRVLLPGQEMPVVIGGCPALQLTFADGSQTQLYLDVSDEIDLAVDQEGPLPAPCYAVEEEQLAPLRDIILSYRSPESSQPE